MRYSRQSDESAGAGVTANTLRWSAMTRAMPDSMAVTVRQALAVLLALVLVLIYPACWAQSTLSGTISSHTVLRASDSPYLLQGDVVLDGDATLSIEPGVTLRMAAGASFLLKKGALQAAGTPDKPIRITSAAQSPAPGDWRQWRMTSGTRSAQTLLNHVTIEYGSGVVIESAAPSIHNTAFNHHSGPAISVDLASSPTGSGNSAMGNSVNAIAVPAGTIRSQVVWGMIGIPYLVQQGLIQVGQPPLSIEPARLRLSPGVVAMLRASLSEPAPAQGVILDITSSVPSVASAVSRVTVEAGQTGADLEVQASTLGTTRVTASHATLGFAETQIEVVDLPSLRLAPGNPTVGINRPYPMAVSLPAAAPVGGVAIQLGNADDSVLSAPSSVLVPAGQQSASFEVTGLADGSSRLTAQAEGHASALATVSVRGKALVLPGSIIVAPGAQTTVTLQATEPAPAAGLAVSLALEQAGLAQAPASVNIPAGQSKVEFTVQGQALGTTRITATAAGYQPGQALLRIDAISLHTDPSADLVMNEELSRVLRVQLSKAAPPGGITVSVASQNPAVASVAPAEVFIPQGQIYATVPITVQALSEGQTALDITSPGLIAKTVKVNVRKKFELRLNRAYGDKAILGKGMKSYWYEISVQRLINGVVSTGADAMEVSLRCAAREICSTPATVTIPAGQSTVNFAVSGLKIGSTQIEATAATATAAPPLPTEVIAPQAVFNNLDYQRNTSSVRDDFYIQLLVPGAYFSNSYAVTETLMLNISLADQNPEDVVTGIHDQREGGNSVTQLVIKKGENSSNTAYIDQPTKAGTYHVAVDIPEIVKAKSGIQTVATAEHSLRLIRAYGDKAIIGKGMNTYRYEIGVQRLINGVVSAGADAVEVNLRCAASEICSTPASVTIPAGQSTVNFVVTGLEIGSTQIEATAAGATAATALPAEVIAPQAVFNNLDYQRNTSSVRDDFYIQLLVPGAYFSNSHTATETLMLNISLADQNPEDVVTGIHNQREGGNSVTQLVIKKGENSSNTAYIDQPTKAGTYHVAVDIAAIVKEKSGIQTVATAEHSLRLIRAYGDKAIIGKGMNTYRYEIGVQRLINGVASTGADALEVNLRCADREICSTPATVTIPAGQSTVNFVVTGLEIGSTQIEATAAGATAATALPTEVIAPQAVFNNLADQRTTSSIRDDFYIQLQVPGSYFSNNHAATDRMTANINLTDQNPEGVVNGLYNQGTGGNLITQLVIDKGSNQSNTAYISQPEKPGNYRVEFNIPEIVEAKSKIQTVAAAEHSLQLMRTYGGKAIIGKGMNTYRYEIRVERLINGVVSAGADAVEVNLRCMASDVCATPATVTIPAGQSTVNFVVTGLEIGSTQIEATAVNHSTAYLNAETIAPTLHLQNMPASMQVGQKASYIYVTPEVPGAYYSTNQSPAANLSITFTSSVPAVGTITDHVTWNANTSSSASATFTAAAPGTTRITASAPGFIPATSAPVTVNP